MAENVSLLHENLVLLDYECIGDREAVLKNLAGILQAEGYVKDSYTEAILTREREYPTGLNTPGIKVVMPHAAPAHVNKAAILAVKLKTPVTFKEMGNSGKDVEAKLVFMLAVTDPQGHLQTLSKLMAIFSDGDKLLDLYQSGTKQEFMEKLNRILA